MYFFSWVGAHDLLKCVFILNMYLFPKSKEKWTDFATHILDVLYVIVTPAKPCMNQNLLFLSSMNFPVFADIIRISNILVVIVITNQLCQEEYFLYWEIWTFYKVLLHWIFVFVQTKTLPTNDDHSDKTLNIDSGASCHRLLSLCQAQIKAANQLQPILKVNNETALLLLKFV